jgi:hypothetical protein
MLKKRHLFALALTAAAFTFSGAPARAFPTGNSLTVISYFSDAAKTHLIGQRWSGCSQPAGSWGTTSNLMSLSFPAC